MNVTQDAGTAVAETVSTTLSESSIAFPPVGQDVVLRIREALAGMKFGQVTIAIKDGQVVQVDRLQQTRLFRGRHR
jgi:hypothetical protein